MSTTNYSKRQVMLSIAYLAYTGELITTQNPEVTIAANITKAIPQIPSLAQDGWDIVWGPALYTVPGSKYQDNLMYVLQNQKDSTQYAIGIRGTNFVSDLDWLMEDFDVLQQMNWPPGSSTSSPAGAMISEGASIGLQILLNMKGKDSITGNAIDIVTFLKNRSINTMNVCVTGHSLGGMLCGTLALYLQENQAKWDLTNRTTISAVSFAAPSAGNAVFATHSDNILKINMDRVACDKDVAPLFYDGNNIYNSSKDTSVLFSTYDYPSGNKVIGVTGMDFSDLSWGSTAVWIGIKTYLFPMLVNRLVPLGYTQVQSNAIPLKGTFKSLLTFTPPYDIKKNDGLSTYFEAFIAQGTYQHSDSYPTILNVPSILNPKIIIRD